MLRRRLFVCFSMVCLGPMLQGCGGGGGNAPGSTSGGGGGGGGGSATGSADRSASLAAVEDKLNTIDTEDPETIASQMAAYFRSRSEFEDSGVESDGSVWARYTDGRLVGIVNNRLPFPASKAPAFTRTAHSRAYGSLPSTRKAFFLDGLKKNEQSISPMPAVVSMATDKGYQPAIPAAPMNLTVETAKQVQNAGLLYITGHSTIARERGGKESFIVFTNMFRTKELDEQYKDDLDQGRLCYVFKKYRDDNTFWWKAAPVYGITGKFIEKYMTFATNSVVVVDSCSSNHTDALRQAFVDKGASLYLGWSERIGFQHAYDSILFLFDRLLGANKASPVESPHQRPFDIDPVLADMKTKGLTDYDDARDKSVKTSLVATRGLGNAEMLAPTISQLFMLESANELIIAGGFGNDPGFVTMNGNILKITKWTPSEIDCDLPNEGPSSCGDVQVTVDNHKSNVAQLTAWRGTVTYTLQDQGTLKQTFTFNVRFRADAGAYRPGPGQTPVPPQVTYIDATPDSTCKFDASGVWNNGFGTTYDWSGSVTVGPNYIASPDVGALTLRASIIDKKVELLITGSVAKALKVHHVQKTPDGEIIENKTEDDGAGAQVGQVLDNIPGGLRLQMQGDYSLPAGEIDMTTASAFGGDYRAKVSIKWSAFMPTGAPNPDGGRSANLLRAAR